MGCPPLCSLVVKNTLMREPESPASGQAGFTLVELVVTLTIGVVVLLAVLALLDGSSGHGTAIAGRVAATDDVDAVTSRLGADVRQTYAVAPSPSTSSVQTDTVDLKIATRSDDGALALHAIRWDCTPPPDAVRRTCTRRNLTDGTASQIGLGTFTAGGGPLFAVAPPIISGVGLPLVRVRVSAPIDGRPGTVDVTGTFAPRNCQTVPLAVGQECPWP